MPYHTLCCRRGAEACQQLMKMATDQGLTVNMPYPQLSPNIFNLSTSRSDQKLVNQFLEQCENDSDIVILYSYHHHKCVRDPFRSNAIPRSEQAYSMSFQSSQLTKEATSSESELRHNLLRNLRRNIHNLPDQLVPAQMRSYYNFPTITPTQRTIRPKIAVISLGGYYLQADLDYYWNYNMARWNPSWGWPTIRPLGPIDHVVGDNILPEFSRDIYSLENTLDLELIGGFCPSADLHFYSARNTYQGYLEALQLAIADQMDIVSTSWGGTEEIFYGVPAVIQIFNDVLKAGVTGRDTLGNIISTHYVIFTSASGDYGSADNDYDTYHISPYPVTVPIPHVDFPTSSPWVISCGGTSLFFDADTQIDEETAWVYGGGGESAHFLRPDYQGEWQPQWPVSPIAKKDPSTGLPFARTVPDIAFNADPNSGWYIFFANYNDESGGTSCCAPIMGALLGEFYCASKPNTAPVNGYFGEGFNPVFYRAPSNCVRLINFGHNVTVDRQPLTVEINPYGLIDQQYNTYYKIWPGDNKYTMCCGKGVCVGTNLITFLNTVVCVAYGTLITMADGQLKPIELIERGDQVMGYQNQIYRVADINRQFVPQRSKIDLIEFLPDSLGAGIPSRRLLVTNNHPIFYKGARRPAKAFRSFPTIIEYNEVLPSQVLQAEVTASSEPIYYLYDLQFDDDGSYIAEGVTIQSRSPWSDITPLAKELYFDPARYREETDWDGFNHQLPLDERDIPKEGVETLTPLVPLNSQGDLIVPIQPIPLVQQLEESDVIVDKIDTI